MPASHHLTPYCHLMKDICTCYSSVYDFLLFPPSLCLENPSLSIRSQFKATLNLGDSSDPLPRGNKWGPERQSSLPLKSSPTSKPKCFSGVHVSYNSLILKMQPMNADLSQTCCKHPGNVSSHCHCQVCTSGAWSPSPITSPSFSCILLFYLSFIIFLYSFFSYGFPYNNPQFLT